MVIIIGSINLIACFRFGLALFDFSLNFILFNNMKITSRITNIQNEITHLPIMQLEDSWIDWFLHFFGSEIQKDLVANIPRVHEIFPSLILPTFIFIYFHILTDFSFPPENRVSDFFEYAIHIIVPVCPVNVCTTLFDLGSVSHILIVLSADPVITNI